MVHSGLRFLLAGVLLCLSAAAWSTAYTITTTEDHPDGEGDPAECSLRDALMAINTQADVNGCDAGTGNDRIRLQADEIYELTAGPLQVGGMQREVEDGDPVDVHPSVRFSLESGSDNATIIAAPNERVFDVMHRAQLRLARISLEGAGEVPGDGGLVLSEGSLNLSDNVRLTGGEAQGNGGAIAVQKPVDATLNVDVTLDRVMLARNIAGADGGALYLPPEFNGRVNLRNFYVGYNQADGAGGGLRVRGESITLVMESGTITWNSAASGGAGLHVDISNSRNMVMNNITLANNYGTGTPGAESGFWLASHPAGEPWWDLIFNSALVGNVRGDIDDCGGPGMNDLPAAFIVFGEGCPVPERSAIDQPNNEDNFNQGSIALLQGLVPDPASPGEWFIATCQEGSEVDCRPIDPDLIDGDFPGFLPNFAAATEPGEGPSLLEGGSPVDEVNFACASRDQRGKPRVDRCDIGAHEFQKATGAFSHFKLVKGEVDTLDVVKNDLGDSLINCLHDFENDEPVNPTLDADRIVLDGDGNRLVNPFEDDAEQHDSCLFLVQGSTIRDVDFMVQIDEEGYPRFVYDPNETIDGFDFFSYRVKKKHFQGATFGDRDVSARASVESRPESGFKESKNIDDFISSAGSGMLALLLIMGLFRRFISRSARPVLFPAVLVALFSGAAHAAVIEVDDPGDEMRPASGGCTLRGAVDSATQNWVSDSFCGRGSKGPDTIRLPGKDPDTDEPFEVLLTNTIQVGLNNPITIEGQGVDETIIRVSPGIDASEVFRLFETRSSVTFRNLTLRGGDAGGGDGGAALVERSLELHDVRVEDNQARNGGAFYFRFNNDERRSVSITNSYFRGNAASENGGVFSTFGQTQEHNIEIFNSTFHENWADQDGGVFDINFASRSSLFVINSTFLDNGSGIGGSVLDMQNMAEDAGVHVMNSSFLRNFGGAPEGRTFHLGEVGESFGNVDIFNSVYADTGCGNDADRKFRRAQYTVFSAPEDEPEGSSTCGADDELSNAYGIDVGELEGAHEDESNELVLRETEQEEGEGFIPPHLPVSPAHPGADYIIDQGNDQAALASGTRSVTACRVTDKRDRTREAGDACDRGSYEHQSPTAGDVTGTNGGRGDRTVVLDVFENALPGDGFKINTGTLSYEDGLSADGNQGHVFVRKREDLLDEDGDPVEVDDYFALDDCGVGNNSNGTTNSGGDEDDCVLLYLSRDFFVDEEDKWQCPADVDEELFRPAFEFKFRAESTENPGTFHDPDPVGEAEVRVANVPPETHSGRLSLRMEPGGSIRLPLKLSDPDGDNQNLRLRVPEQTRPQFSLRDFDEECDPLDPDTDCSPQIVGVGLILPVDMDDFVEGRGYLLEGNPENRFITYKHRSTFQTFRDRFSVRITDECGSSRDARFEVTFPKNSSTSDDVLSGSTYWWHLLALLGLGLLRRRNA